MKKQIMRITAVSVFGLSVLIGGAAIGAIKWSIRRSVEANCRAAQEAHPHPGNDVAALVEFMNSEEHSLWDRTHKAVWTLGQLRDPRALPALESVYTGEPCDHDRDLCQYELEKAVKLCEERE